MFSVSQPVLTSILSITGRHGFCVRGLEPAVRAVCSIEVVCQVVVVILGILCLVFRIASKQLVLLLLLLLLV